MVRPAWESTFRRAPPVSGCFMSESSRNNVARRVGPAPSVDWDRIGRDPDHLAILPPAIGLPRRRIIRFREWPADGSDVAIPDLPVSRSRQKQLEQLDSLEADFRLRLIDALRECAS